jgi:uncharacterized Tic20 family protein
MSDLPPPYIAPQPPLTPAPNESTIRSWNMWCHLSALAGLLVPFGNVLGPLVVWLMKKGELPSVDAHGKAALNFQLTVLIATIVAGVVMIALWLLCIGWIMIPVIMVISIGGIIFSVIAGVKASEGKPYEYPYSFKLIS